MITDLTIKNFQKHKHFSCTFTDGLNLIVGPNWAGKTTLLRAIAYALYGSAGVDVRAVHLIKKEQKNFEVIVGLDVDDKHYVVRRTKTVASVSVDGVDQATSHTEVTHYIEDLLGISAKHFLSFNLVRQEEASQLLKMGGTKLGALLNETTGVDLIDRMITKAKSIHTELKWAEEAYSGIKSRYDDSVEKQEEYSVHRETLKNAVEKQTEESETSKTYISEQAQRVSSLETAFVSKAKHQMKKEAIEQALIADERLLEQLRSSSASVSQEELMRAYQQLDGLEKQKAAWEDYQSKGKQAAYRISQIEQQIDDLIFYEVEDVDGEELIALKKNADSSLYEAKAALRAAEEAERTSTCPSCHRPFEGKDPEALKNEVAAAKIRLEEVSETAKQDLARYAELSEKHGKNRESAKKKTQLEKQLADEKAALSILSEVEKVPHEAISEAHLNYSKLYAAFQAQQDNAQKISDCEERIAQLNAELKEHGDFCGPSEEAVSEAREELGRARAQREKLLEELNQNSTMLGQYETFLNGLAKQIERDSTELGTLSEKAKRARGMEDLIKYLRRNRERYFSNIWEQLLSYTSEFVSDATGGAVSELTRSTTGEFLYVENGTDMSAELASGMQSAILGVSLKLALGAALGGKRRLLLLDEATAAGSDENSLLMTQLLNEYGGQVILVTHRQADAVSAKHVVSLD